MALLGGYFGAGTTALGEPGIKPTAAPKPVSPFGVGAPAAATPKPVAAPVPTAPKPAAAVPPPSINVAPKPVAGALPLTIPPTAIAKPAAPAPSTNPHQVAGEGPGMMGQPAPARRSIGSVPYGSLSNFGPQGDLRGTQIAPGGNTVDRFGLAQQRYNEFNLANKQSDFDATRAIAQRAAAAGRLGSGMVDQSYQELARTIGDRNSSAQRSFLQDALEGSIGDASNQRNELRTERGYQQGAAQQSLENRIRQQQLEEQLTQGQFGRDETRSMDQAQIGFQNNPWQALLAGSGQQQQQADQSGGALAELLRQYAFGRSADPNLDQYGRPAAPTSQGQLGAASTYHFPTY